MKNGLVNVQSFPCVQNEKVKVNVQEVLVTEKERKVFAECSKVLASAQ